MAELGHLLSEARAAKDLSVPEVENAIRIRQKYLEALESGDYAALPHGATGRGFLRNYARFLGVDVDQALRLYVTESGDGGPVIPVAGAAVRPTDYRPLEVSLIDDRPHTPWWRWPLAVAVVALLAMGGWGLFGDRFGLPFPEFNLQPLAFLAPREPTATPTLTATATRWIVRMTATPPPPPPAEATQAVALPTSDLLPFPTPTVQPTNTPVPQPTATPQPVQARIMLHAEVVQLAWVLVEVDGETVEQGMLEPGQQRDWEGDDTVYLRVGNGAGVVLTLNNEDLGPLGNVGQVVERRWVVDQGEVLEATGTPRASAPRATPAPGG